MTDAAAWTPISQEVCGTCSKFIYFFYIFVFIRWQIFHLSFQTEEIIHVWLITDWVIYFPNILNDKPQIMLLSKMNLKHSANKHFSSFSIPQTLPLTSSSQWHNKIVFYYIFSVCQQLTQKQYTERKTSSLLAFACLIVKSLHSVKRTAKFWTTMSCCSCCSLQGTRNPFTFKYHNDVSRC